MKKILVIFLFILCSCQVAFCTKPCNGLCGFKLAEKMDKNKISQIAQTTKSGRKKYYAKDYKKFMDFNMVTVDTLPDDSIFTVYLLCYPKNAESYFYEVLKAIETHYEIDDKDKLISDVSFEKKAYYKFPNASQMIVQYKKGNYNISEVSIFLASEELIDKANRIDVEKTIDTSALEWGNTMRLPNDMFARGNYLTISWLQISYSLLGFVISIIK